MRVVTAAIAEPGSSDLPAPRLRRVTRYIEEHLESPLRLGELSALAHMSPFHFARLFKRSIGVPPHVFVIRRRNRDRVQS
jgi:AraC family transcriptional regulator